MTAKGWFQDIKMDSYPWQCITPVEKRTPSNVHKLIVEKFVVLSALNPDGTGRKFANHDFKKNCYFNTESNHFMAVYKGSLARIYRGKHGNAKFSDRIHYQTSQSVAQAIRKAADDQKTAGQTLMELRANIPGGLLGHRYVPRNSNQVTYQRSKARLTRTLSRDDMLYSIHAVRYVREFCVLNNNVDYNAFFLGRTQAAVEEFEKAYSACTELNQPMILYYDTSFDNSKIGYVSPACYGHPILKAKRGYKDYDDSRHPLAMGLLQIMIHQTKDPNNHVINWAEINKKLQLADKNIVFVSDREFYGHKLVPNAKTVLCWNHIIQGVKRKATQLCKLSKHTQVQLTDCIKFLLQSDTLDIFRERLDDLYHGRNPEYQDTSRQLGRLPAGEKTCCQLWQYQPFQEYFDTYVKEDIILYAGTWYLRTINVPEPHKGLTSNRSECLNHMMNCFSRNHAFTKDHKPTWSQAIILSKVFAEFMDKDIYTGYYDMGPYEVDKSKFPHAAKEQAKMKPHLAKTFLEHMKVVHQSVSKAKGDKANDSDDSDDSDDSTHSNQSDEDEEPLRHPVEILARTYLDQDKIIARNNYWLVEEVGGPIDQAPVVYSVTIQPGNETCSCIDPFAKKAYICAHYLAVAVHTKLRVAPLLTEKERELIDIPEPKKKFTGRPMYGKKDPSTLNKQNPYGVPKKIPKIFVDQGHSTFPRTPRTPGTTPRTPRTGTTPRTPRTPRTPAATYHASAPAPAALKSLFPTGAASHSTHPVFTSTGTRKLQHVNTIRGIKLVLQGKFFIESHV